MNLCIENYKNMTIEEYKKIQDICGNIIIDIIEIDGEKFNIRYNRYNNEYSTSYKLQKDARTGTLIRQKNKEVVIKKLLKVSKRYKIYV